jgi:hypothetical protein
MIQQLKAHNGGTTMTDPDTAWKAYCRFAKCGHREYTMWDMVEPWERGEYPPPKPKKTSTRRRKMMTLNRALKQAMRAGVSVVNATLTPDGVRLEIANGNGRDTINEWDAVQ